MVADTDIEMRKKAVGIIKGIKKMSFLETILPEHSWTYSDCMDMDIFNIERIQYQLLFFGNFEYHTHKTLNELPKLRQQACIN